MNKDMNTIIYWPKSNLLKNYKTTPKCVLFNISRTLRWVLQKFLVIYLWEKLENSYEKIHKSAQNKERERMFKGIFCSPTCYFIQWFKIKLNKKFHSTSRLTDFQWLLHMLYCKGVKTIMFFLLIVSNCIFNAILR